MPTQAQLLAEIATNLPTNGSGTITASILRTTLTDIVSAIFQGISPTGLSTANTWTALQTFNNGITVSGQGQFGTLPFAQANSYSAGASTANILSVRGTTASPITDSVATMVLQSVNNTTVGAGGGQGGNTLYVSMVKQSTTSGLDHHGIWVEAVDAAGGSGSSFAAIRAVATGNGGTNGNITGVTAVGVATVAYKYLVSSEDQCWNSSGADATTTFSSSKFSCASLLSNAGTNSADAAALINPFTPITAGKGFISGFFVTTNGLGAGNDTVIDTAFRCDASCVNGADFSRGTYSGSAIKGTGFTVSNTGLITTGSNGGAAGSLTFNGSTSGSTTLVAGATGALGINNQVFINVGNSLTVGVNGASSGSIQFNGSTSGGAVVTGQTTGTLSIVSNQTTGGVTTLTVQDTQAGNFVRSTVSNNSSANNSTAQSLIQTGVANVFLNSQISNSTGTPQINQIWGAGVTGGYHFTNNTTDVAILNNGLQVGASPTGGDKGAGTINTSAGIFTNTGFTSGTNGGTAGQITLNGSTSGNATIAATSTGALLTTTATEAWSLGGTTNVKFGVDAASTTYNVIALNGDLSGTGTSGLIGGGGSDTNLYYYAGGTHQWRLAGSATQMELNGSILTVGASGTASGQIVLTGTTSNSATISVSASTGTTQISSGITSNAVPLAVKDTASGSGVFYQFSNGAATTSSTATIQLFTGLANSTATFQVNVVSSTAAQAFITWGSGISGGLVFNNGSNIAALVNGLQMGTPTGGDQGVGTINVSGSIFQNGSAYTHPDFVFEKEFTNNITLYMDSPRAKDYQGRMSLNDLKSYIRTNYRLPRIPNEPTGIFARADIALEKIEELVLYTLDLHDRISILESN